ncbi:hypothetical protein FOZ60_008692 [Perkinsus olseni]|uniref:RanBD1 domain-containing protein n=1 Tax=Perkinsus olseni TaxID=32597 RepID=A0A7J6PFI6_PEROL|nr:hypothetical protein FOZ60_008692 [Perkinsus olseni]
MSKRVAESQLTKDDAPEEDNVEDPGTGRERASADILAKRKIVSVRRKSEAAAAPAAEKPSTASETESVASSQNPFANLGTSSKSGESEGAPKSSNPFSGISFASASKSGGGSLFGDIGKSMAGGAGSGFAAFGADQSSKSETGEPTSPEEGDSSETSEPQPHPVCSGEEGESLVFSSDCKLYKLMKQLDEKETAGSSTSESKASGSKYKWTERGMGSLRVLKKDSDDNAKAAGRIVVRMKGVWKVILNTPILDADKYELVGTKSVKFFGLDDESDEEGQLASYRVNLLSSENQSEFLKAVKSFSPSGASTAAPTPEAAADKKEEA